MQIVKFKHRFILFIDIYNFSMELQLIHDVVLISSIWQSDSVIHI